VIEILENAIHAKNQNQDASQMINATNNAAQDQRDTPVTGLLNHQNVK